MDDLLTFNQYSSGTVTRELITIDRENRLLDRGQQVIARWPANGFSFRAKGTVTRLSSGSVTVELTEAVGRNGEYRIGSLIEVPRFSNISRWSSGNCVRFVPKRLFPHKDYL